ncbi:diguanylate cyclase, partial [Bradyrhizobium uaiense]|uniref:diguanylate cyclase n=1 Tax=Bradyrhizobium uaiense TaxID=2594946 RepID=UPI001F314D72
MIEACDGTDEEFAVLCVDLDGLKEINDVYGHAMGDKVLIEVAEIGRRREGIGGGPGSTVRHDGSDQAKHGPCRNRILPARLPLPASHRSPEDFSGECPAPAVWIG